MGAEIWQLVGSLLAILLIVALVQLFGFTGARVRLSDADAVQHLSLSPFAFIADQVAVSSNGDGAIARSTQGNTMLLRRHGAAFIAIPLEPDASVSRRGPMLAIRQAGCALTVDLGDEADAWEARVRAALAL